MTDTPARASADATSPETMPCIWYCESCGQMAACEIVNGEIVCGYKHIVATFDPHSCRALPTGPTRADIALWYCDKLGPDHRANWGIPTPAPCDACVNDVAALFPAPDAGPERKDD